MKISFTTPHLFACLLVAAPLFAFSGCQPAATSGENQTEISSEENSEPPEVASLNADATQEESTQDDVTQEESTQIGENVAPEIEEEVAAIVMEGAPSEVVMLGPTAADLTSGIPGEGELTMEQIEAWLADPKNHEPLKYELPLGLSVGAGGVVGIDENPLTRAKVELGRQLYFDGRLSGDSTISCATCHHPDTGWTANTQFGVGIRGQEGGRNSPASYNRILSGPQFWDGRAATLEEQAVGPIANPIEMGNTHEVAVSSLGEIPGYKVQFEKIFGELNIDAVAKAIAAFERVVVTGPAPFDYYERFTPLSQFEPEDLMEDEPELYALYVEYKEAVDANPMSESAIRGRDLFFGKANCTACHVGANLSDELYHNLGVGMDAETPDLGRFEITGEEKDRGAFKTPTVRNVAQTAPYMHDGSQKTLAEVVEWYNKGGHPNPHLSDKIKPLNLTDQEKADVVAFMEACTGEFPAVEVARLPQ